MNRKIYISGAITGRPYEEAEAHFAHAESIITALGKQSINPLKNGLPRSASWAQHMIVDLQMLMQCSEIFMLDGWELSEGAKIEHTFAIKENMPITYLEHRMRVNYPLIEEQI